MYTCHNTHAVVVRRQPARVQSLLPPRGSWRLNSGFQEGATSPGKLLILPLRSWVELEVSKAGSSLGVALPGGLRMNCLK